MPLNKTNIQFPFKDKSMKEENSSCNVTFYDCMVANIACMA